MNRLRTRHAARPESSITDRPAEYRLQVRCPDQVEQVQGLSGILVQVRILESFEMNSEMSERGDTDLIFQLLQDAYLVLGSP